MAVRREKRSKDFYIVGGRREDDRKSQKALEDSSQNPEAQFRPIVRSGFEDCLNGRLPLGYNKLSMAANIVR